MRRGEVWRVHFPKPRGSEPGHARPALVVQADVFNQSAINTVVVVPFTTNLRLADLPGNVLIRRRKSGLPKDSVANVSQIATVDRGWLSERVGSVTRRQIDAVEDGLRLLLAL